jgi:hypothetical protein
VLGFYLRMEDMSSPWSEIEWADLFTGPLCTHHRAELGVRAELSSGCQWGSGGGGTTLLERLPCGHMVAFHNSGDVPSEGGTVLRAECRMGP